MIVNLIVNLIVASASKLSGNRSIRFCLSRMSWNVMAFPMTIYQISKCNYIWKFVVASESWLDRMGLCHSVQYWMIWWHDQQIEGILDLRLMVEVQKNTEKRSKILIFAKFMIRLKLSSVWKVMIHLNDWFHVSRIRLKAILSTTIQNINKI